MGPGRRGRARGNPEFDEDVGQMPADGLVTDEQLLGDVAIGGAGCDTGENLDLPTGQPAGGGTVTSAAFIAAFCGCPSAINRLKASSDSRIDSLPCPNRHAIMPNVDRSSVSNSAAWLARPKHS